MKKALYRSAFGLAVPALWLGAYLGFLQLSGNFHTVIAGELYRSAQPTVPRLEDYAAQYGIRTIINLRGPDDRSGWYRNEVETARRLGLRHIDFEMSASQTVTPEMADRIVRMLRDAPKPILIHCKAGSDRSGLVAAIYSREIAGFDDETAEGQLSISFGHIGVPYLSSAYAMDESWETLEGHFAATAHAADRGAAQTPFDHAS